MGGLQCVTERLKYSRTSLRERCEVVTVVTGSVYTGDESLNNLNTR